MMTSLTLAAVNLTFGISLLGDASLTGKFLCAANLVCCGCNLIMSLYKVNK